MAKAPTGPNRSYASPDNEAYAIAFSDLARELTVTQEDAQRALEKYLERVRYYTIERYNNLLTMLGEVVPPAPFPKIRPSVGRAYARIVCAPPTHNDVDDYMDDSVKAETKKAQGLADKCVAAVSEKACQWLLSAWREGAIKQPPRLRVLLKRSERIEGQALTWPEAVAILRNEWPKSFWGVSASPWAAVEECRAALELLVELFGGKRRRPGRRRIDKQEEKKRLDLIRDWNGSSHLVSQEVFCGDHDVDVTYLEKCINWKTQRERREPGGGRIA